MGLVDAGEARSAWFRWKRGDCPCCPSELVEWDWNGVVYQPEAVAEGVILCGRCIGNEHHRPAELRNLLELLAAGAQAA